MSDNGDRTCPLCAEEMDLTDQQLKPCKCGYEICVWCWHQIMDMAEKENSEGRCPACRTIYDKERIVGMTVNCERLVIESNTEKRYKTQKTKLKMSADARKNLSRVRVVQRNLVYIIGLPSHLADEIILERREYFGQYGKILKVSISRLAATAQQASSNCFSVYITYAREEDAIRCIQSVHNYTLEGKSLRACFGTTKYCHSWLRNMTCSNPDCLYLHDIGCQEDSFTKDEIISAYSRSRVPQVALSNLQRRSGNILPPPADDLSSTNGTSSSKTCLRMSSNNTINHHLKSTDVVSSGRSKVLPPSASWGGSRVPNNFSPLTTAPCFEFHPSTSSSSCISAWNDSVSVSSKAPPDNREPLKHVSSRHDYSIELDDFSETSVSAETESSLMISAWDDDATTKSPQGRKVMTSSLCKSTEILLDESCNYAWDDDVDTTSNQITDGKISSLETLRFYSERDSPTSLSEDTAVGDEDIKMGISAVNLNSHLVVDPIPAFKEDACDSQCPVVENSLAMNSMLEHDQQQDDSGEGNIISNILALDFDPWDDSLESANNFTNLLNRMDKKGDSSASSSSWKLQNSNQSRFSFARQENSENILPTAASHVEKSSSSTQESFRDGYHSNALLNTIGGRSATVNRVSAFSSNNSAGTLRPKMATPPGFSVPYRAPPPPGFSSKERYDECYSSASEKKLLLHASPIPNQFEVHSVRNTGDVEFIDPAILAVGKGILPLEVDNNNSFLGLNSVIPSQFCTVQGNRMMQQHQPLAAHHDAYMSSRFQSYSPFIQQHQQLTSSNMLNNNSQLNGWQNVLHEGSMGMSDVVKNERFGLDSFIPIKEEQKFSLSTSTDLYTRPYGL